MIIDKVYLKKTATDLKKLVEKVAIKLCHNSNNSYNITFERDEKEPKIYIDGWVSITLFIDDYTQLGRKYARIRYTISHQVVYPARNNEPEDVDVIDDKTCESPWQAITEAFELVRNNELNMVIQSVNEDEGVMEVIRENFV